MHPTQTKQQARQLYLQTNLTRTQIAEMTGISQRTLFDWIKEGDWMRARANAASAPALIAESYYNQLTELNKKIARRHAEPFATLEESTIIRRLAGTIKAVRPARNRNEATELLAEFSRFVRKYNAACADVLTDIITAFLETINTPLPAHQEQAQLVKEYDDYLKSVKYEEQDRIEEEQRRERRRAIADREQREAEARAEAEERRWQQQHNPAPAPAPEEVPVQAPTPEPAPQPPAPTVQEAPLQASATEPTPQPPTDPQPTAAPVPFIALPDAGPDDITEEVPGHPRLSINRARQERVLREVNEMLARYKLQQAAYQPDAATPPATGDYGLSG